MLRFPHDPAGGAAGHRLPLRRLVPLVVIFNYTILGATGLSTPAPGFLFWPEAPPNLDTANGGGGNVVSSDTVQRYLAVLTGHYHLEMDVLSGRVNRFRLPAAGAAWSPDRADELMDAPVASAPGHGRVTWTVSGRPLSVTAAPDPDYAPEFFPVRVVESGPWFQHFSIHDLIWSGEAPPALRGGFWMEIMAWPDRVVLMLRTLDRDLAEAVARLPGQGPTVSGIPAFSSAGPGPRQELNGKTVLTFATLEWWADGRAGSAATVSSRDASLTVRDEPGEGIPHFRMARMDYRKGSRTALGTPIQSGHGGDYRIRLTNPSPEPSRLDFGIELPDNRSLTGHSLMLLDSDGNQTGIPVQISKNWHIKKLESFLPYMGTWSHGRLSLILPPGFDQELTVRLVQGDYGDYNAASIAQLSLIGWGGNGIWIQAALGSWGETVCLQPGRVLRRTLLTDWRPFKSTAIGGGEFDWPANAGGADIFVYHDTDGNYVPFAGNKHLIRSYGPCLAQMDFHEVSRDRRIEVEGTWHLPMSDDVARAFLTVRADFHGEVDFSRFSILQVGADQYNPTLSTVGAAGNREALLLERPFAPAAGAKGYFVDPVPLMGYLPWLTLYGDRFDPDSRLGQSQRVVVIHSWKAVMGGVEQPHPQASFYNSRLHGKDSFQAELVPGPEVQRFVKGDTIEMILEFVLMPLSREGYYGGSPAISALIEQQPNSWELARAVAAGNDPRLAVGTERVVRGPLPGIRFAELEHPLTLSGTTALVPLTITGIPAPGRLLVTSGDQPPQRLTQEWRSDSDGTWIAVLILDPDRLPAAFTVSHHPGAG